MPRRSWLEGVEHVIWDWNGTLLDDVHLCIDVMNGLLREEGLEELDLETYRAKFDFPVRRYYEKLGFDLSGNRFEELGMRFIRSYYGRVHECGLQAGAAELLEGLSSGGVESSILSAAERRSIQRLLAERGIRPLVQDVVGLEDHYAHGKEELGRQWIAGKALDRRRTLLVGDTAHDHEVAQALGVRCVLVAGGHHPAGRLERCGVPVLGALAELA